MLFRFFDISNSGFIEKEEFIKMLFNYPKQNIFYFMEQIRTASNDEARLTKGGHDAAPRLDHSQEWTQSEASFRRPGTRRFSAKKFPNTLVSDAHLKRAFGRQNNRLRGNQPDRFVHETKLCTTLNSSIKYIAEIVYDEIGEGNGKNRMSYANFESWISRNEGILTTFDKWLRKDIWSPRVRSSPKADSPCKAGASIEGYVLVNMKKKDSRLKFYQKLFLSLNKNVLAIYSSAKKGQLVNLYILRELQIYFDRWNFKIKIWHALSGEYLNLTMALKDADEFFNWKFALKPFMMENVEEYYCFLDKIGVGNYSVVNLAEKRDRSGQHFAIKTIDHGTLSLEERALICEEAKIISKLNHPNVIKFYHNFGDYQKSFYVFELVKGGDLFEYVLARNRLDEAEARHVFRQLVRAVEYLHREHVLHRDLKPENILVTLDESSGKIDQIKLIDFGFATFFSRDSLPSLCCGTLNYAAPEVLVGEEYDESSDVYSCGVILFFM